MKKSLFFFAITCLVAVFTSLVFAAEPLADFLVKKGLITDQDVADYEKEAKCHSLQTGSCDLTLGGYVQAWFTSKDDAVEYDDTFSVGRGYMWLRGYVAEDWFLFLSYYVSHDFLLLDAQVTYEYAPFLRASAGLFLLPYSLEQLTSSSRIDTILRAQVSDALADHRDIGVMVDGAVMEGKVGYGVAFVNGAGLDATDDNDKKDIVARIWAKPFLGSEGSPLAGLMVAGAMQFGETPMMGEVVDPVTGAITAVDLGDENRTRYIGTGVWQFNKIKIQGEYLYQELEDSDVTADGYYVVATYDVPVQQMVLQPVAKYEMYDANDDVDDDEVNITTLGANLFLAGGKARVAVNYRLIDETPEVDNNEILGMFQLVF